VPFEGAGAGNIVPPSPEWAADWAARNQCDATPQVTNPRPDVKINIWGNCKENASVVLYARDNEGHSWPGSRFLMEITSQAVNATDVMWDFFKAHPMQ
jgi:polyhydroxybutyrate depolymerase